jgi:hypothetical protein
MWKWIQSLESRLDEVLKDMSFLLLLLVRDEEIGSWIRIRLPGTTPLHMTRHPALLLVTCKKETFSLVDSIRVTRITPFDI